jgi:DNA-binding response OmpR family regulator
VKKVLIVDDDATIHSLIAAIVQMVGDLKIEFAHNGRDAFEKARLNPPDLIISDIGMGEMDGFTLCQNVREHPAFKKTCILLLTARHETQDKYHGFLQGADDYMVKPFDAMELQLRIKALLRRSGVDEPVGNHKLTAGPLTLDPHRYLALMDGMEVRLTASEFAIMRLLVERPVRVLAVEVFLREALDYPPHTGNPQVIHTHMKNIRAKFRLVGLETTFLTSSRRGYLLETQAPATTDASAD